MIRARVLDASIVRVELWTPSGRPLLFETYTKYGVVTQRTVQLWCGFAAIVVSSLLLLLLPVLWMMLDQVRRSQARREELLRRGADSSAD